MDSKVNDFCCSNVSMLCYKTNGKAIACTIEFWIHLGGLLSTQEATVALLRFFRA